MGKGVLGYVSDMGTGGFGDFKPPLEAKKPPTEVGWGGDFLSYHVVAKKF